jgi:gamma-tubulin complex component 3
MILLLERLTRLTCFARAADSGWDIFCLHYRLDAPINSVINDDAILEYQKIFDFLWRLKRVEYSLSGSWSKDMNLGHMIQVSMRERWNGCNRGAISQ